MRSFFLLLVTFSFLSAKPIHQLQTKNYTLSLHQNPFFYQIQTAQGLTHKGTVEINKRGNYKYVKTLSQDSSKIKIELEGKEGKIQLEFIVNPSFLQVNSSLQLERKISNFSPFKGQIDFHPKQTKILENGYDYYYDYYSRVISGTDKAKSNWGALFTDQKQNNLFIGFLQYFKATGQVFSSPNKGKTSVQMLLNYDPKMGSSPQKPLTGEPLIFYFEKSSFQCLESVAKLMAKTTLKLGYYHWFGAVPDGWCSYQGGPDFGGYGENISQKIILKNLASMKKKLKPYGIENFQISQGWETYVGDWTPDSKKFPKGMKWLADEIKRKGFIPGLIISPFTAHINSNLHRTHKDWFVSKSFVGRMGSPKESVILDISKPVVKKFILDNIRKATQEWGFKYLRMDNNYWALFGTRFFQSDQTYSQIFVQMIQEIRDILPEDVFLSSVGIVGLNYHYVHGVKSTMDNVPRWIQKEEDWKGRGLKETYRTIARRYYFQKGYFIQDPDLIYFRSPLTWGQSLCYLQAVGYCGGTVKVGEPIYSLKKREIQALGSLLPSYSLVGTPQDLFHREFPECWTLPIKDRLHVGFFNWGENIDLSNGKKLKPVSRKQVFDLTKQNFKETYHAVEFWSGNYLGKVSKKVEYQVPSQNVASITLTPVQKYPTLIHSNRHLFLLTPSETSYFSQNQLNFTSQFIPNFEHHLMIYVPKGWRFLKTDLKGAATSQKNSILYVVVKNRKTKTLKEWSLFFEKTS